MSCRYTVYLKEFEHVVDEIFAEERIGEGTILVLDEVGKMELFSEKFKEKVSNLVEKYSEVYTIGMFSANL